MFGRDHAEGWVLPEPRNDFCLVNGIMHVLDVAVRCPETGNGDQHAGRRSQQLLCERLRFRDVLKHLQAEADVKPLFALEGQKVGGNAFNRRGDR